VNLGGVVGKGGLLLGRGAVWNLDFLLDATLLARRDAAARARTFVEALCLERHAVAEVGEAACG
jgi:hypothetical protein